MMLFRKLIRTAWSYKAQFISMMIMITLGMGMFLGFNMEWYTIEVDTSRFFEDTRYADYRLYSQDGFSEKDIEAIELIDGIYAATRFFSLNLDIKDEKNKSLAVDVSENFSVSTFVVTAGADYDENSDGIWLSDKFALMNDIKIGDTLTLELMGNDLEGEVVGLIKSGEHMICLADTNQMMPDYHSFGYAYITPKKLETFISEKSSQTIYDELKNLRMPEAFIGDLPRQISSNSSELLDSVYAQVNVLSDMDKESLEKAVKNALDRTIMVTPKEDHVVYQEANGEAEEGKTMGSILPVLFLLIAILTMVTTMHRIVTKEKIQIGTLKALGFKNRRILRHYTSYGLFIGAVGTGLGVLLGYFVCRLIMSEDGMMGTYFDMPDWSAHMPAFCIPVMILTVVMLTLISFLSARQQLKGTAADALRPYVPKKMRKSVFERLKGWDRLRFGTKWNIRDLMRHKSRSAMTLVGIVGCMVLMVGGLGMRDTMSGFLDLLDHEISNYTTKVNLNDSADIDKAKKLAEDLDGDIECDLGISLEGDTEILQIYDNACDLIRVIDENNRKIDLSDEGVYLCLRLKDRANIGDEITFSPYGSDDTYTVKVIGYNRSVMTESITMTAALADRLGIDYTVTSIYTALSVEQIPSSELISGKQDRTQLMDTFQSFTEIMDTMVIVLVIAAIILGIVVLYNLGIMSYVERSRELATLKVLGFKNNRIRKLLITQNLWLTVIGVAIGLPAGVGVLELLLIALAGEYEMKLMLGVMTYTVSVLLTFGVSLLVGLMVSRKNKKIDMVEALKGAE